MPPAPHATSPADTTLRTAFALALATAVSLGLARFSYGLMLPPMRADLGWSYLTAGAMNTVNAAGYLAGALSAPGWLRRTSARRVLLATALLTGLLLAAHGGVRSDGALYALRFLTGLFSAGTFVAGGLLAARLASRPGAAPGLVLGIYYGGAGVGIVVSSLLVPALTTLAVAHAWQWAWVSLGGAGLAATAFTAAGTRGIDAPPAATAAAPLAPFAAFDATRFVPGLAAYFCFGLGYIGYMTFIVTLLREQSLGAGFVTAFFTLLGLCTVGSSWVWAGLLQRHRGGVPLASLNGLLALATLLPVASAHPAVVLVSGALFGGVFLSVVASTTALVRHNTAPGAWPRGISAFTITFAAGQIVGPSLVGWVADGPAGLRGGLAASAAVLALAAGLGSRQRALADSPAGGPAR